MHKRTSLLFVAFLFPTLNCGTGTPVPPPTLPPAPVPTTATVAGNWEIKAQSAVPGSTPFSPFTPGSWELVGSLESTASQVTGVLLLLSSPCYIPGIVSLSGTINESHAISLTSNPVAGQVLTISGVMSSDHKTLLSSTYAIDGGCGNGEHGTMTGFLVPPFTNTYSGTFTSFPGGKSTNVTVSLTQSPTADAAGLFPMTSARATFTDNACFSSGELSSHGGLAFGIHVGVDLITNDSGELSFQGALADTSDKTIVGTYVVRSGACTNEFGTFVLTHS